MPASVTSLVRENSHSRRSSFLGLGHCLEWNRKRDRIGTERHAPEQMVIGKHASTLMGSRRSRKNPQDIFRHRVTQPCQNPRRKCCSNTTKMNRFAFCVRRESTMN